MTSQPQNIQIKAKTDGMAPVEQTQTGPVFKPAVDIFEDEHSIGLIMDIPGVKTDGLNIDLRDDILIIDGKVQPMEGKDEQDVMIEYEVGRFYRRFTIPEQIDQAKIEANLKDGVLYLGLPKMEKAKPRRITVKSV